MRTDAAADGWLPASYFHLFLFASFWLIPLFLFLLLLFLGFLFDG